MIGPFGLEGGLHDNCTLVLLRGRARGLISSEPDGAIRENLWNVNDDS